MNNKNPTNFNLDSEDILLNDKKTRNSKLNNGIDELNKNNTQNTNKPLLTVNDIITGKSKDSINNLYNDKNNNYNKYDIDDMLYSNMNENNNENYYSKDKNSFMKNSKQTKSNVLKESGQNIIYGMNDLNNKYKEKEK